LCARARIREIHAPFQQIRKRGPERCAEHHVKPPGFVLRYARSAFCSTLHRAPTTRESFDTNSTFHLNSTETLKKVFVIILCLEIKP
jgi:hypothetical protein